MQTSPIIFVPKKDILFSGWMLMQQADPKHPSVILGSESCWIPISVMGLYEVRQFPKIMGSTFWHLEKKQL